MPAVAACRVPGAGSPEPGDSGERGTGGGAVPEALEALEGQDAPEALEGQGAPEALEVR
jgi:hypothetical protein